MPTAAPAWSAPRGTCPSSFLTSGNNVGPATEPQAVSPSTRGGRHVWRAADHLSLSNEPRPCRSHSIHVCVATIFVFATRLSYPHVRGGCEVQGAVLPRHGSY